MKLMRRVAVVAIALVASTLSLVSVSAAPAHAAVATKSHLTVNGKKAVAVNYGKRVTFDGWVSAPGQCSVCYPGKVQLQRKVGGGSWTTLATRALSASVPAPTWKVKPNRSAYYRLRFLGYEDLASPSASPAVKVTVRRVLNDNWRRSGRLFYGKVAPAYKNRPIIIQKSTCARPRAASCKWTRLKSIKTNRTSNWKVKIPVQRRTTHYRAYIAPSNGFGGNTSKYFITTRRG
ncbi:hypothetical protein [Nocardioides sp. J54]|uniref:hypothetical protein n=1 Tax=Nocardioides sp. J54 TaxID=935866 RepID=UPI0012F9A85E|nr:hypothetical protein [Nocardioides sp. J54]